MIFRARSQMAFFILSFLLATSGTVRAGSEDEVKAVFTRFVAAQNAHDLKELGHYCKTQRNFCGSPGVRLSGVATQR